MRAARIDRVVLRRPDLRTRFPRRFAARLEGQTVRAVERRAKYLLVPIASGETLILIVFNDPRRFGFMDLAPSDMLSKHPAIGALGPEPLSGEFDAVRLARACAGKKTSLKAALLDQRVVAGLGNIYVSEALHVAGLSPQRKAKTIATPSGTPRDGAHRLAAAIKLVLEQAIERASDERYRGGWFRVYDREGERCRRRGCGGVVRRRAQGGRSTFYCRDCQR
jgi:formamidopyrimidine-DNA glycosylase